MQKLQNNIIHKMIDKKLSSSEIDFILYISRYQADSGIVHGVYYKDVCAALDISYQQFYNIKDSLVEKGIITAEKVSYYDYDIVILDNDFSNPVVDAQKGYINTNHDIFFSSEFKALKSNAKLLAMDLMKITYAHKGSYQINVRKFFSKYMAALGISLRHIRNYLMSLKIFFSIGIKSGIYFITPKKNIYRSAERVSEALNLNQNEVKVFCRRNKIEFNSSNKNTSSLLDVAKLIQQYRSIAASAGHNIY